MFDDERTRAARVLTKGGNAIDRPLDKFCQRTKHSRETLASKARPQPANYREQELAAQPTDTPPGSSVKQSLASEVSDTQTALATVFGLTYRS